MNKIFLTVICPIYNEEKYIKACVDSILSQDFDKNKMELLLVDGLSTDETRKIIKDYEYQYKFIKLIDNPNKTVPYALNRAIKYAHGDIIMRIDAHCTYPENYISTLVKYLFELNADNVGAIWNTRPAKDTIVCNAIAYGCSNSFGVGGSKHKIGVNKITEVDTVPFGCYRKEVFERIGLFDEDLVRNQDDEFNARLLQLGGKIYLIPELIIDYTARDKITKMMKMYYQYGLFKPLVNKKLGKPATWRQFFPMLFVLGVIVGAILSVLIPYVWIIYFTILLIYFLIGLIIGIKYTIKEKNFLYTFIMPYIFFLIHGSYGIGYINGIYKIIFKREFIVKLNR